MSGNNVKRTDMLPMGVIYGSMTLKRYRKLEALHRKAHAALRAAFDTTGLAEVRSQCVAAARELVAPSMQLELDHPDWVAYNAAYDAIWDPYYELEDKVFEAEFNRLCDRAATKALWNAKNIHLCCPEPAVTVAAQILSGSDVTT